MISFFILIKFIESTVQKENISLHFWREKRRCKRCRRKATVDIAPQQWPHQDMCLISCFIIESSAVNVRLRSHVRFDDMLETMWWMDKPLGSYARSIRLSYSFCYLHFMFLSLLLRLTESMSSNATKKMSEKKILEKILERYVVVCGEVHNTTNGSIHTYERYPYTVGGIWHLFSK